MSEESGIQDTKSINIREVFTDQVLESIVLSRLGSVDPLSKDNALNPYANRIAWFQRRAALYDRNFPVLEAAIEELRRKGNFKAVSGLDQQSQAIIKTAYKPAIQKVK